MAPSESPAIEITPEEIAVTQASDTVAQTDLTVTNSGDDEVVVRLLEVPGAEVPADLPEPTRVPVDASPAIDAPGHAAPAPDLSDAPVDAEPVDGWDRMPSYPVTVTDNRVVRTGTDWFSIGGWDLVGVYDQIYRLGSEDSTWTQVGTLPELSVSPIAEALGETIVVTGGQVDYMPSDHTWLFDTQTGDWSEGAPIPVPVSQAGSTVMGEKMYVVGGCHDGSCNDLSTATYSYDELADEWEVLADYPLPVAYQACGAVDGALVCSGGLEAGSASYSYDPGADSWTQLPDAPADTWASAYSTANNHLVVAGGLQDGAISNRTYAWSGIEDAWIDLPPAEVGAYRGGGACGFLKVGGRDSSEMAGQVVEQLAGFDSCEEDVADVPWLEADPSEVTVPAGGSVTVQVHTDSTDLVEGRYTASFEVRTNGAGAIDPVPVMMTVANEPVEVDRLGGADRYATAAMVAATFEPGVPVAFLATGTDYPDALSGSALAGSMESPVLLTRTAALPQVTRAELERLQPQRVVVLGGDEAVSDAVLAAAGQLTGAPVERITGAHRYATAADLAGQFTGDTDRVFVATGTNYPDALAGAARAGALDSPVLLVQQDHVPAATAGALADLAPEQITVLGGEGTVDESVVELLRQWAPTERVGGLDRYRTAVAVSQEHTAADTVFISAGSDWPDALAGSARAGVDDAPVLLAKVDAVPAATRDELIRLDPDQVIVVGGPTVVNDDVLQELRELRQP